MEWEVWAERVPDDGIHRALIRVLPGDGRRMPPYQGIPIVWWLEGPYSLLCWPIPEKGWRAVAWWHNDITSLMLTREPPVELLEGPW